MSVNETVDKVTRRRFMGASAVAGAMAMNPLAGGWVSVKDAAGLQYALDSLPKQGGTIHIPAGIYRFDRPVTKQLREGQHLFLVGDGRGTVLHNANTRGEPLLHISGITGSWWPDLRITIRDISFTGNYQGGDALIVDYPNDTLVDSCFFLGHGGQAMSLVPHGTNVTVRDCWIRDCRRGIRAENIHHLTLHGNQTRSMAKGQVQEEHIYISWDCREVRIVNNHIAYGANTAIVLDGTAQHVVANNTIEGFRVAIEARGVCDKKPRDRCRDIAITSNYLHADTGIRLVGECRGFAITGNDFVNNNKAAIIVEQGAGAGKHAITGNMVRKSVYGGAFFPLSGSKPDQGGFRLGDSEDCIVSGNLLDGIDPAPAISAGPGGGRHIITNNRIILSKATALDIKAPGCLVENNLTS